MGVVAHVEVLVLFSEIVVWKCFEEFLISFAGFYVGLNSEFPFTDEGVDMGWHVLEMAIISSNF
jgi:hypothetical protein